MNPIKMVCPFSFQPCTVVTSEQMVCLSPGLRQSSVTASMETLEEPMILNYGFLLDGVQSMRNLTGHSFLLYPDPEFEEFENKVKRFFSARNEYLTINVGPTSELCRL